jgi:uncharacterized protein with FMN-binding domain
MKSKFVTGISAGLPLTLISSFQFPASAADGQFTGPIIFVNYGNVQVEIQVKDGKIVDAKALVAPNNQSQRWSDMAIPVLKTQTLAAQSDKIQGASGASYTSYGWVQSLQGALALAGLPEAKNTTPAASASSTSVSSNSSETRKFIFQPAKWDGLPSNLLTPGVRATSVNQNNVQTTICSTSYIKKNTPTLTVLNNLKTKQIKAGYIVDGITGTSLYSEDHLIPIDLGGSPTSEENLWPELIDGTNGFLAKNQLEKILHDSVCNGQLTLEQAQNAISTDWMDAYNWFLGKELGTRYANSWVSGTNGLVSMDFSGGKDVTCGMNRVHSIDMNMYGITDWTLSITLAGGIKSETISWNVDENIQNSLSYSNVNPGTYLCEATINGEKGVIAKVSATLVIDTLNSPVRAQKVSQIILGTKINYQMNMAPVSSKPIKYKNCAALNLVYPGGVALPGAVNKGGSTQLKPTFDRQVYSLNTSLDRDKDGIACEK